MKKLFLSFLILLIGLSECTALPMSKSIHTQKNNQADICIYGATSAGIIAAYTAFKEGKSVILIEPSERIGGLTAGGLGETDIGKIDIIRGLSLDFYQRVGHAYGKTGPVFQFEPKIALAVFQQYLKESNILVCQPFRLRKVNKKQNKICSITLENSQNTSFRRTVFAKVFLDCSYEGDLMARAGISYTVGRESNTQYGETFNGVQMLDKHQFPEGVDPYKIKGNPKSGLLYGICKNPIGHQGEADHHIQAYNFRITLTNNPKNRIEITKPENYDSSHYELLLRQKEKQPWQSCQDVFGWSLMPNNKTDLNNNGGLSTDMIGESWNYPEASYAKRDKIWKKHLDYTKGFLYFIGHDKRIPQNIRQEMLEWGYPNDEYTSNDHFTPKLYIREARRMIGRMVMTQAYCQGYKVAADPISWAAYTMDSHNAGRYVVNGMVKNEGDVQIPIPGPYNISYRCITPREEEACNLLVPVCLSASHIAYGSIRMEPVFMVLGETAALAACEAINHYQNCVQQVDSHIVMQQFEKLK